MPLLQRPKGKTLEIFGANLNRMVLSILSIYSMRQAIEEGFILDVLANYTTYKMCYQIAKNVQGQSGSPYLKAVRTIRRYEGITSTQPPSAESSYCYRDFPLRSQKKSVAVERWWKLLRVQAGGSRYYHEIKRYLESNNYDDVEIMIAS